MSLLTLDRIIHLLALAVHRGERLLFWTASQLGALSPFRFMPGRIPCHHRDGSGSQHYVLPQELSRQVEHGEACHPWSNHENGQRPRKPLGETEQRTEQRLHQKTSFLGYLEAPS